MKRNVKIFLFCAIAILFVGCDHVTKELAKQHLKNQPSISYLHDLFRLDYAENTGAFLSFGDDWSPTTSFWIMNVLPLLFLVILFAYGIRKTATEKFMHLFPYVLICAGGLGNIIDRIVYDRHVTDFMNMGINGLRTGIFNLADLYVSTGVIMLLIQQWKISRAQKKTSSAIDQPVS